MEVTSSIHQNENTETMRQKTENLRVEYKTYSNEQWIPPGPPTLHWGQPWDNNHGLYFPTSAVTISLPSSTSEPCDPASQSEYNQQQSPNLKPCTYGSTAAAPCFTSSLGPNAPTNMTEPDRVQTGSHSPKATILKTNSNPFMWGTTTSSSVNYKRF